MTSFDEFGAHRGNLAFCYVCGIPFDVGSGLYAGNPNWDVLATITPR